MRVLLSAYACQPGKGSEPYVGWTWPRAIARVADEVHAITRAENRGAIDRGLAADPIPNAHFHYFDLPNWGWLRRLSPPGPQIHYYAWQHGVGRSARRMHERHAFDVVHHLTYAGLINPPGIAAVPACLISRAAIVGGIAEATQGLGNPALRRRMGKAGRQRVQDHFSLPALDRFVERLYGSRALLRAQAQP